MSGILQKIKTILLPEVGLDLEPPGVVSAEVSTDFTRNFAYVVGKGPDSGILIRSTTDGRLFVAAAGTSMEAYYVENGNAPDAYNVGSTFEFTQAQYVTDFLIETFAATISFRNALGVWGDDKAIPVGAVSLDLIHYGVKIQNRTALSVSVYEITTYR